MHRCIDLYFDPFLCFDSTGGIFFVIVTTFIALGVRNILSVVQDFYPEMIHQVGSTEAEKHVSVVLEAFESKSHTEVAVLNSTSSFSGKLICTWLGCFFVAGGKLIEEILPMLSSLKSKAFQLCLASFKRADASQDQSACHGNSI